MPIFRQVMRQVQRGVAQGRLRVGDRVPSVRVLAEALVINPNTVARAYQELIREGVLESRPGRGLFVTERRRVYSSTEKARRLLGAAERLCHEALLLDAGPDEVRRALDSAWKNLQETTRVAPKPERKPK